MKSQNIPGFIIIALLIVLSAQLFHGCGSTKYTEYRTDTLFTNTEGKGNTLEFQFRRGPEHNHPLMALWLTDTTGKYIQTLYVAESIAKGVFGHGDQTTGKWLPGAIRRPATLPVWAFDRGVKEKDGLYLPTQENPIPDAYTGATPQAHFVIIAKADEQLPDYFKVWFELNQSWDWNNFWNNNKYPDDEDYKTSCQPALVYSATLNLNENQDFKNLDLIGHSHFSGKDGKIYSDVSTISTAKEISQSLMVRILK
jgi:hypothetical protein